MTFQLIIILTVEQIAQVKTKEGPKSPGLQGEKLVTHMSQLLSLICRKENSVHHFI